MFYENFLKLANLKNKSPSAVALECGLKKSTVTKWKRGGNPTDATARRIADYFGVTIDYLMRGEAEAFENKKSPAPSGEAKLSDIEFALWGELRDLDDEDKEELLRDAKRMRELKQMKERLERHDNNDKD